MATNALSYKIGEMKGFPFEVAGTDKIAGDNASYVIPVGIENNVTQLHQFLFAEENYVPSEIVQSISNEVSELSGIYPENEQKVGEIVGNFCINIEISGKIR